MHHPMTLNISDIDLICYDFDGVMTDNRALVLEDGTEAVYINRGDGLAVAAIRKIGIPQVIISTEENPVVGARANKLKIPVLQGISDKRTALEKFAEKNGHSLKRVVYIGNDINDLEAMQSVGFPIAPADAHHSIRDMAAIVTSARGGEGVVREFLGLILDNGKT